LTFKAEAIGYHPQVILAGRRINDGMAKHVAEITVKKLIQADKAVRHARVLVLGLTFKENVPDIRNSKVIDIVRELEEYGIEVLVHDPIADPAEARHEYGVELVTLTAAGTVDAVVWAVAHERFRDLTPARLKELCANGNGPGVIIDVKNVLDPALIAAEQLLYWSL
jgi:UDP-N-acetyl-D-galactosamine dehydrogenase